MVSNFNPSEEFDRLFFPKDRGKKNKNNPPWFYPWWVGNKGFVVQSASG